MTKKSHKRIQRRKEDVGCMWGLIGVFDFRRGRLARRLLSDRKCGSSRNSSINYSRNKVGLPCNIEENHGDAESITHTSDTEAEEDNMVNLDVSSFSTLMKKEMSRTHHSRREFNSKIELVKAELGIGLNAEMNHKEATKSSVVGSENNLHSSPNLISQQFDSPNMKTMLSPDLDLGEFLLDYCNNGLCWEMKQFEYKNKKGQYSSLASNGDNLSVTTLQKAIVDLIEAFLRENSNNSSENKEVHQSKDMVNVLEMLNSNKPLFLKLLQDPNSPVRKQIQEFQNVHFTKSFIPVQNQLSGELPRSKKFQIKSGFHLCRKKDELKVASQSNAKDDVRCPNRIVVLKPTKERNQNLSNAIAPIAFIRSHCNLGNKEGGERPSSSLEEFRKKFRNVIRPNKKEKHRISMDGIMHKIPYGKQLSGKNETSCGREHTDNGGEKRLDTKDIQKNNESSIASKTALSKNASPRVLKTEAAFCDEAKKHLFEFLQIGSENESLSPIQASKSLGRILSFSGFEHLSPRHNLAGENLDVSRNKECFPSACKIQQAENEIMEIVGVEDKECIQIEEVSQLEAQSVLIINEVDLPSGTFKVEESSMLLEPEQSEPKDRPSPISVLEPLSFEDENILTCMKTDHGICPKLLHQTDFGKHVQHAATNVEKESNPRQSQIDDSAYVSASTDFEEDLIACTEFDEASLFDQLEFSYSLFIEDPKFLFDSIDEVLTEMKERHFSCTPWVSFIKPTIWSVPKQEYFMKEACRRINWHLDMQFPTTLIHAVKRDLDGITWFDLQLDAENAVGEIGDAILDYLFEETTLELCD